MVQVTAPSGKFNGKRAGVTFSDGKADVTDGNALAYFARHGYLIEGQDAPGTKGEVNSEVRSPDATDRAGDGQGDGQGGGVNLDDLGMEELKAYASEHSIDIEGHQSSKDALRTRIREAQTA